MLEVCVKFSGGKSLVGFGNWKEVNVVKVKWVREGGMNGKLKREVGVGRVGVECGF